jgi:hypothetical protein
VAGRGRVTLPAKKGEKPSGDLVLTRCASTRDRADLVRNDGDVRARFTGARVTVDEIHAVGDGIDLRLRGVFDGSGEKAAVDARASGTADAAVLGLLVPDLGLAGKLTIDVAANGPLENPALGGTVRIENGRYRTAGYSFDDIEGGVRLIGSWGARGRAGPGGRGRGVRGGDLPDRRNGGIRDFPLRAQGRHIQVRAIPSMRLTGGRRPGRLGRPGRQRDPRPDHACARHLFEGRRADGVDLLTRSRAGGARGARSRGRSAPRSTSGSRRRPSLEVRKQPGAASAPST